MDYFDRLFVGIYYLIDYIERIYDGLYWHLFLMEN